MSRSAARGITENARRARRSRRGYRCLMPRKRKPPTKEEKIGDDILDLYRTRPLILADNKTIRFPWWWTKKDRDRWRKQWWRP